MFLATTIAWVMSVAAVGPGTAPDVPKNSQTFATLEACQAASQTFMIDHQFMNWQGLKMNPLVRTTCTPKNGQ